MDFKRSPQPSNTSQTFSVSQVGESILVRVEAVRVAAPDELVAFPFGLERAAAARAIRDGHLPAARIGRRVYARNSDVLALVGKLALTTKPMMSGDVGDDYSALVASSRGRK